MGVTAGGPLRLGLLSTARINREILAAAASSERVDVVAVGSRDRRRAEAYAAEHGLARAHGSYEGLLADPEVDAAYVSLPNGLHHEWTLAAIAAGKHVLCEKPYSRVPAEVEEGFAAAAAAGVVLMEGFMYRHHPQTLRVQELVAGGAIGRLCAVSATFTFPLADLADVRALPELDGGALMDVGCYCVSGIRLLAGEPERVSGEQVVGPTGIDIAFHGTLRCPGGVVGQLEASFRSPRRQRLEVVGEDGVLTVGAPWRADWGGRMTLARRRAGAEEASAEAVSVPEANAYRLELENLADAASGLAPPLIGKEDALGQARAIEALYAAAASGGRAVPGAIETGPGLVSY